MAKPTRMTRSEMRTTEYDFGPLIPSQRAILPYPDVLWFEGMARPCALGEGTT